MNERALISLSGGGDRQIFWVAPAVLAWMLQDEAFAASTSSRRVPLPASVAEIIRPDATGDPDREKAFAEAMEKGVAITIGSYWNDKALVLATIVPYHTTMKGALSAARANNWDIAAEFDGSIY